MMSEWEFYSDPFTLIPGGIPIPASLKEFYFLAKLENPYKNKININDMRKIKYGCL